MNLGKQGDMLTETSSGENVGEADRALSGFDLGIENISSSHAPCKSFCVGTNETSSIMGQSDDSGADLLMAFDSISVSERLKPNNGLGTDCISAEALDLIGQVHLSEQRSDSEKNSRKYNSSGLASVAESSGQGGAAASEVFDGFDESCKLDDPLIVYSSSQGSAFNSKINHKKSRKKSKHRGKSLGVNLDSLQISRKSRSSCSKRAESSVCGYAGNILTDSEDARGTGLNLENEKKLPKAECGKGKKNSRDQMGQQSVGKTPIPTGRISLKIKIGNKICGMNNAAESLSPTVKDGLELHGSLDNKLQEVLPEVVPPATYVSSTKLEASNAFEKPSYDTSNDCHHLTSTEDQSANGNIRSDVGTSPDSEIINPIPSVPLSDKDLPDLQERAIIPTAFVSPSAMSNHILSPEKSKKGGKQENPLQPGKCTLKIRIPGAGSLNNTKVPISKGDDSSLSIPQAKSKKGKKKKSSKNSVEDASPCVPAATVVPTGSEVCNKSVSGRNSTNRSRGKEGSRNKSRTKDLSNKKDQASKKKGNVNSANFEHQEDEMIGVSGVFVDNQTLPNHGESGAWKFALSTAREQHTPRNAWVLCDECEKWRRIPAKLADQIEETNCGWTCKENTDKDFADCSIPQEKSNSEINKELEISEASGEEDAGDTILKSNKNRPKVPQQSEWSLIKSNLLLHRSRKTQNIDEVMVCHCKPPSDGKLGCGAKCLNRMLNIECVRGTCPCGERCSNQQFQKRNYAKLKWFKCGKKGYGLQALKDISYGQFLIEYVGEILDVHAYEARQKEYALNGHRHFYFMTLNGSEVIDACAKGNLARFINHSCSPNCRTEKWMVNGEVCVGLFALRDIKKGEELTFDYNYVRVFGAAAKKCVCGSSNCRGYIGGDPTNSEVIVQDDSDDEFSEPVMTCGDRELNEDWKDIMLTSSNDGEKEIANKPQEKRFNMEKLMSTDGEDIMDSPPHETLTQRVEGLCSVQVRKFVSGDTLEMGSSAVNESVECLGTNKVNGESLKGSISSNLKADGDVLQSQIQMPSKLIDTSLHDGISCEAIPPVPGSSAVVSTDKSLSDTVESKRKLKYAAEGGRGEFATPNSFAKTKRKSSSVRKVKPKSKVIHDKETPDLDKLHAVPNKSKKLPEPNVNSQFEAVKEALNELLEPGGGISKRRDASRVYLKLLYLTAASGNNVHGGIERNRDLSMILDALLKTKSRAVLDDIINKNGLQMLHNIMKRYRTDYHRTPILRKLFKVLEHLALLEVLTLKHITGGPPRVGVESFKDSILFFTEHDDRQVHMSARSFRDKWIPRPLRKNKNYCMGRERNGRSEANHHSNYDDLPRPTDFPGDKGVKPPEASSGKSTPDLTPVSSSRSGTKRKRQSRWDIPGTDYPNSRARTNDDDTPPPGFSPPCFSTRHHENPHDVFLGDPQPRFAARMPVSYGIPYSAKRQVEARPERCDAALAVPFHPFPPLPPFTQQQQDTPTAEFMLTNKDDAEYSGQDHRRTSSSSSPIYNASNHLSDGISGSLGRKYFRQQKWSHSKFGPPRVRTRND